MPVSSKRNRKRPRSLLSFFKSNPAKRHVDLKNIIPPLPLRHIVKITDVGYLIFGWLSTFKLLFKAKTTLVTGWFALFFPVQSVSVEERSTRQERRSHIEREGGREASRDTVT